jgi:acyl carrier protein
MSDLDRGSRGDETVRAVERILRGGFIDKGAVLDPDASLFDSGVIDSMGLIRLLACIEKDLGVSIPMSEIVIENFDSVNRIADSIRKSKPRG